jgi:hypothetical protein
MKTNSVKITLAGLFAAAFIYLPAQLRAQESTNTPAATAPAKPKPARESLPFTGKLVSVDTNAMTFTVAKRTFAVTSETRINKAGKPATLSEGGVGETVSGAYKKAADGTLHASTVNFGPKAEKEKKAE